MNMPQNRILFLTQAAKSDINDIMDYGVENFGYEKALSFIDRIFDVLDLLCESHYKIGNSRRHIKQDLFSFPVESYVSFFYRTEIEIKVVRILHHSKDINSSKFLF